MSSIHQFVVEDVAGKDINFADFAGKKILVVNVASECGFTSQYAQLQELYNHFQDKLTVVGFPSNDFGGQEPGSNEAIATFCTARYGVTFPLAAKIRIKGDDPHPVYRWLTNKDQNGVKDSAVQWNFQKYLLDEEGHLIDTFPTNVSPTDEAILHHLQS